MVEEEAVAVEVVLVLAAADIGDYYLARINGTLVRLGAARRQLVAIMVIVVVEWQKITQYRQALAGCRHPGSSSSWYEHCVTSLLAAAGAQHVLPGRGLWAARRLRWPLCLKRGGVLLMLSLCKCACSLIGL
jgi:hypothetical protein